MLTLSAISDTRRPMKTRVLILSLNFLSINAFAVDYTCNLSKNSPDTFGQSFTASLEKMDEKGYLKYSLKLDGIENGLTIERFDTNYRPQKKNAGSIRFSANVGGSELGEGTGCGDAKVVLDDAAASGLGGDLYIAYDCDSDGSGPAFYDYDCTVVKHKN